MSNSTSLEFQQVPPSEIIVEEQELKTLAADFVQLFHTPTGDLQLNLRMWNQLSALCKKATDRYLLSVKENGLLRQVAELENPDLIEAGITEVPDETEQLFLLGYLVALKDIHKLVSPQPEVNDFGFLLQIIQGQADLIHTLRGMDLEISPENRLDAQQ